MKFLTYITDCVLCLLMLVGTTGRRLRRIYRKQLEDARLAADAVVAAAQVRGDQLVAIAKQDMQTLLDVETAKARKIAQVAVAKETGRASRQAVATAREDALIFAYNDAAVLLGLTAVANSAALESRRQGVTIDITAAYPNIYDVGDAWVVRVLHDADREVRTFSYTGNAEKARRLVDAVRARDTLAGVVRPQHASLYDECLIRARQLNADESQLHVRAAEQFHTRLVEADDRADHFRFVGTDPEDRLQIADHAILLAPLSELVINNRRVLDAFAKLGLDKRRTVRDLLLLTGDELLEASGFGASSLRRLRTGLAQHGLALWGDAAPAAPSLPLQPGERSFRAIDFE